MPDGRERIVLALDADDRGALLSAAAALAPHVGVFKVGLEAFVAEGPGLVREVAALGRPVFLDLKLHDIPNTVAGAARAAARSGAAILTVHASGGAEMMLSAAASAREGAAAAGFPPPRVVGVTVLTSLGAAALAEVGVSGSPREAALRLALLAREAGLDGVVCSPEEVAGIRGACGGEFLLVVPGIRPKGSAKGDQSRVATPFEAARDGADLLVVGRPISRAADPASAAASIAAEIAAGLLARSGSARL